MAFKPGRWTCWRCGKKKGVVWLFAETPTRRQEQTFRTCNVHHGLHGNCLNKLQDRGREHDQCFEFRQQILESRNGKSAGVRSDSQRCPIAADSNWLKRPLFGNSNCPFPWLSAELEQNLQQRHEDLGDAGWVLQNAIPGDVSESKASQDWQV